MRQSKEFLVITFSQTTDAMAAELLFRDLCVPGRIIPIPRQLSAGCGLAFRTGMDQKQQAQQALVEAGIRWHEMEPVRLLI